MRFVRFVRLNFSLSGGSEGLRPWRLVNLLSDVAHRRSDGFLNVRTFRCPSLEQPLGGISPMVAVINSGELLESCVPRRGLS